MCERYVLAGCFRIWTTCANKKALPKVAGLLLVLFGNQATDSLAVALLAWCRLRRHQAPPPQAAAMLPRRRVPGSGTAVTLMVPYICWFEIEPPLVAEL